MIVIGAPPAHVRSQVEPEQLTEQEPVQVTWQVELLPHETLPEEPTVTVHSASSHEMLPLSPVVSSQLEPPLHSALQEPVHAPWHWFASRHRNEQLPPSGSQPWPSHWQEPWASQVHDDPLQAQPSPGHGE